MNLMLACENSAQGFHEDFAWKSSVVLCGLMKLWTVTTACYCIEHMGP